MQALGTGSLPPVLTDGLHRDLTGRVDAPVLSLGLTEVGQPLSEAKPTVIDLTPPEAIRTRLPYPSLPAEMEARLK